MTDAELTEIEDDALQSTGSHRFIILLLAAEIRRLWTELWDAQEALQTAKEGQP